MRESIDDFLANLVPGLLAIGFAGLILLASFIESLRLAISGLVRYAKPWAE